jgi:peptidoglycan hydrolase-like protein with peptidoglycan-binding domain
VIRFPYGYAAGAGGVLGMGTMLTWEQMKAKTTVNKLHPEVQRRFKALIEHAQKQGVPLGVGTGWRIQPVNKPGFAAPGNSYHEGFPANGTAGNALAIDTVPNISWNWMEANCGKFGLRTFRHVNSEPWHLQPMEISTSRNRATECPPLQRFNLPGTPTVVVPRPTLDEGDQSRQVRMLIDALKFWKWYPEEFMADTNNGTFGRRTKTGVKRMQRGLKLQADGIYGRRTAATYKRFLVAMSEM